MEQRLVKKMCRRAQSGRSTSTYNPWRLYVAAMFALSIKCKWSQQCPYPTELTRTQRRRFKKSFRNSVEMISLAVDALPTNDIITPSDSNEHQTQRARQ